MIIELKFPIHLLYICEEFTPPVKPSVDVIDVNINEYTNSHTFLVAAHAGSSLCSALSLFARFCTNTFVGYRNTSAFTSPKWERLLDFLFLSFYALVLFVRILGLFRGCTDDVLLQKLFSPMPRCIGAPSIGVQWLVHDKGMGANRATNTNPAILEGQSKSILFVDPGRNKILLNNGF